MRKQRGFTTCFICKQQVLKRQTVPTIKGQVCKTHQGVELVEIKESDVDLTNADA